MTVIQGILLGLLQGIAEFLPISSSGHLSVVQNLFGLEEIPLLYDVMLHLATLLAVFIFFRKKIWKLLCIFFRWIFCKKIEENQVTAETEADTLTGTEALGRKTIVAVIATTVITGAMGIITSRLIPDLSIKFTAAGFIITAILLILTGRKKAELQLPVKGISVLQALFIGFMQGIGTLPGISRSGSTIAGACFAGVDRAAAGEFSFIVSIPAILGAFLLEAKDLDKVSSGIGIGPVVAGCAAAFFAGYFSLYFLMKLIKKGKLEWFAAYLIPLGIFCFLFL